MRHVAILDIDGTLVDTNYQHALAWFRAFKDHEIVLPLWRIHRHVGMGGDQLVKSLTDEQTDAKLGDQIRSRQSELYSGMIDEVQALEGASELIEHLSGHGHAVILASSAREQELEHYLDLLGARDHADGWTSSADVESTKPAPDLIEVALKKAGAEPHEATMIGDSVWDARAAGNAGVETIAVMTGGFSEQELREAGATEVHASILELRRALQDAA